MNANIYKPLTAAVLSADPDKLAPVSGLRCRTCGMNAVRRPPDERWVVVYGAAYCPQCTHDALSEAFVGRFCKSIESGWIGKVVGVKDHGEPMLEMHGFDNVLYAMTGGPLEAAVCADDTQWFSPFDVKLMKVVERPEGQQS